MKNKVDIELELAKRMAGEVYPELLRLIKINELSSVAIHSVGVWDINYEDVRARFYISADGTITDDFSADMIRAEEYEYGEADDVNDEPMSVNFNINNIDICPIFNGCRGICYKYYCEQVLLALDMLLQRDSRVQDILKKIDRIPSKRQVIIEKIKLQNGYRSI